jgi:predicted nucleic acid-binding protein
MASLVLPDSNFYITAARTRIDPFRELGARLAEYDFATCGMVVLEVLRGRSDPNILRHFRERFAVMIYLPTTNQIWERATQLAWALDRQGTILPAQDILIAAHALQTDAMVLTYDTHFSSIPGLRVVDHLD